MAYSHVLWFVDEASLRERLAALVRAEWLDGLVSVGAVEHATASAGRSEPVAGEVLGRVGDGLEIDDLADDFRRDRRR